MSACLQGDSLPAVDLGPGLNPISIVAGHWWGDGHVRACVRACVHASSCYNRCGDDRFHTSCLEAHGDLPRRVDLCSFTTCRHTCAILQPTSGGIYQVKW